MKTMRSISGQRGRAISKLVSMLAVATALAACLTLPVRADKLFDAREQFARAVRMRTMLEGYLEKDRSLSEYKQTVGAYHKVYLITAQADDATAAIIAQAELYREMGRLFDPKYFQSALDAYNFLLKQYPGSRYRGDALFSIAQIQGSDLGDADQAKAAYKQYLKQFPHSERAADARAALNSPLDKGNDRELAVQPAKVPAPSTTTTSPVTAQVALPASVSVTSPLSGPVPVSVSIPELPELKGQRIDARVSDKGKPGVKDLQAWNTPFSTRIVATLDGTVKFDSTRLSSPDRIYFDLYKAEVSPKIARKTPELQDGLLKSLRVAQNKPDVVRIVLDAEGAKDYSAYLLSNPYRLVIELRSKTVTPSPTGTLETRSVTRNRNIPTMSPPVPAVARTRNIPAIAPPVPAVAAVNAPALSGNARVVIPKPASPSLSAQIPNEAFSGTPISAGTSVNDGQPNGATPTKAALVKSSSKATSKSAIFGPKPSPDTPESIAVLDPPAEPKPTRDGQRSLTRALGLKISRIVIDAGHGGHDTGTIGPHGLMEKDLCLDVAMRLGSLIEKKLPGADVVYTRKDDTFIPLEERTEIANNSKADLFISIHANSSHDPSARGIETYYLNFATSADSMEVASRENANSQESMHDLQDLIKKIARNEKIDESKELAGNIQDTLTERMQLISRSEKNRGVKKAPFIVLIGANMPSVLTEISFVSNPSDEKLLRKTDQRQRIADGLYRGISSYLDSLNSLNVNKQKLISDNRSPDNHSPDNRLPEGRLDNGTVAPAGNPK